MTVSALEQLRNDFLHEAKSAPRLFKDLAKVEQYIAESYKTRALIELIQNADDAQATNFGLHTFEDGFIVGNNGREFTIEDVEALCRSGSSNKIRGSNTIGYRGIGFKSVVNLAKKVFVFSAEFNFFFDKSETQQNLNSNTEVPLIRVPHLLNENTTLIKLKADDLKKEFNYTSIFVFKNILEEISLHELNEFDRSSLLFLNNIQKVQIDFKNIKRAITLKHKTRKENTVISISEGDHLDNWQVEINRKNPIDRVAYKVEGDKIIPALPKESVIHSFTPTYEFSGAFIKINGDYTTDPSRKTIDLDEHSKTSLDNAVSLISQSIISILKGDVTKSGFFSPFMNIQLNGTSRFKTLLFQGLESNLSAFSNFRLKPEWLNYEDYLNICEDGIKAITKEQITVYPELFSFLELINIRTLSLDEITKRINTSKISMLGAAEIFSKIIKQTRYDLNNEKIESLKSLKMLPVNGSFVNSNQVNSFSEISSEFIDHLNSITDPSDIDFFLKKMNIKQDRPLNNPLQTHLSPILQPIEDSQEATNNLFKSEPAIKRWRSAEQNAAEFLRSLKVVLSVKDVTQANLGYDLEVLLTNGKRIYVEIKSVSSFSEPFKISNNEYSSAHSYGDDYFIGVVINDEPFVFKLISNPINSLSFEKKCERWSWFCEQYIGVLKDVNQTFTKS